MTQEKAKQRALQRHPDCDYAEIANGLDFLFRPTWCVNLWRNEECWAAGDPPRYAEQGFLVNE